MVSAAVSFSHSLLNTCRSSRRSNALPFFPTFLSVPSSVDDENAPRRVARACVALPQNYHSANFNSAHKIDDSGIMDEDEDNSDVLIECRDVYKSFGEKHILRGVSFKGVDYRLSSELSGGMKKRVALARSIIFDITKAAIEPEVLLYDEPTAGLDTIASTVVEDLIRSVHMKGEDALEKPGKIASYVVVTHQHSTIKRAVDRLLFLYEGKVVWQGMTHEFSSSTTPIVRQFASGSLDGPIRY